MLDKTRETAMGAAFGLRGVRAADVEIDAAIAKYFNHTANDVAGLQERVRIGIEKLPGKGLRSGASNGRTDSAPPRQAVEDETGHTERVRDGLIDVAPSSSSDRGGEGQLTLASRGQAVLALPAREPSAEQLAAFAKVKEASARVAGTAFDRMKTSDGQSWRVVGEHELAGKNRDGVMSKAIDEYLGPRRGKQRFKPLGELMTAAQFDEVLARVRGQNDAA